MPDTSPAATSSPEPWGGGPPPGSGAEPSGPDDDGVPPTSRRALVGAVAGFLTVLGLAVLAVLPAPYTSSAPGPTYDTLGEISGTPLITVSGTETYEPSGELRLTTVAFAGSRDRNLDLVTVLRGWVSPDVTIDPVERFFPDPDSEVDREERSRQQMTSSQENATVAALTALGYEVPATIRVVDAIEGTGAVGVLEPEDVVVGIDGHQLVTYQDMTDALAARAGELVAVEVLRDGERVTVEVQAGERPDGGALLGVWIAPEFEFPFDVEIQVDHVGGPSAGMMFALALVDLLTPADEAAGQVVAGTGTIELDGTVGPISGVRQKLIGARRDGADWFLVPRPNCAGVLGNIPDGLEVTAVETLAEALAALEAIGRGETAGLTTCDSWEPSEGSAR